MFSSQIVRHPSCLNAATNMVNTYTTGDIFINAVGCDMVTGGAVTDTNSCINVSGNSAGTAKPGSLTVNAVAVLNAQSVGIQCSDCQNDTITNSYCSDAWLFCYSIASSGSTSSPAYNYNHVFHGNTCFNSPYGVGYSFFLSDISITGNVFNQCGAAIVQDPHANSSMSGNTFDGIPSQGAVSAGAFAPIFLEGVGYFNVGPNLIVNINSALGGIYAVGSNLTLGGGPEIDLPLNHGEIHDVSILNTTVGYPLLVSARSNGPSPTQGSSIAISNNLLSGVNQGIVMGGVAGGSVSGNTVDGAANGGYTLAAVQGVSFRSNYCHNCNTAGGTTYATGTVSGTATMTAITGAGTTFTSGMVGGGFTVLGTTYQVCSRSSNTAIGLCTPLLTSPSGASYSLYYGGGTNYPCLTINGPGTLNLQISPPQCENDSGNQVSVNVLDATGLTAAQSLITYDSTGQTCWVAGLPCAMYSPVPTITPTLTLCGTGSPVLVPGSTNGNGQFPVGGGTVTKCTFNFAGSGFSATLVTCNFYDLTQSVFLAPSVVGGLLWTFGSGATNIAGDTIQYGCNGTQVDQGKYPWPYFWR
jgi:hypothetical protein